MASPDLSMTDQQLVIPDHNLRVLTPAEQNAANAQKLENAVNELLVSSYDPDVAKTIWQCAQCHFSSKVRYTVKQHIETHISGFTHQCPNCEKTCKTRNALRAHIMRSHTARPPSSNQQQMGWQSQSPIMSPDGMMEIQFQEMGDPDMKPPRRPRQRRPYDEELERQIRLLLVSEYDPVEVKTTWSCAQCNYTAKLQYTVKQHIETHITSIMHQCTQCPKILKTRNALRAHMIQKHEPGAPRKQQWMGGSNYSSSGQNNQGGYNQGQRRLYNNGEPRQRRKRSDVKAAQTPQDLELDRQVAELMVSNYDPQLAKTTWQCAQCHFSSKIRSTVKEHIETHISGFTHQCTMCAKTCKTRNALRVHTVRAHGQKNQQHGGNMNHSAPKICYEPQQHHNQNNQTIEQEELERRAFPDLPVTNHHQNNQQVKIKTIDQEELERRAFPDLPVTNHHQNSQQVKVKTFEQEELERRAFPDLIHQNSQQRDQKPPAQNNMMTQQEKMELERRAFPDLHNQTSQPQVQQVVQKQPEQPRQPIMNPMIGRPMYGHPMMMGHPMMGHPQI